MSESYDVKFLHLTTAIKVEAAAKATSIDVDSTTGMAAEEAISIVLDDDSTHWDIITSITDSDTLVIKSGIPTGRHAKVGAVVKTYYAYMLRQHEQLKDWLVTEAPLLPQTLITESASPSSIEPEREIQISQVDWRKGIQDFLLEDEHKYNESENCDARFKGMVILSPKKLSSISFANAPTVNPLLNADLENWTGAVLDNWLALTGSLPEQSSVQKHYGLYAGRWYSGNNSWQTHIVYQDIFTSGNLPSSLKGKVFTFAAWIQFLGTLNPGYYGKVIVDDGASTTDGNSITTKNSWLKSTASHTISATATKLRVEMKVYFCANSVTDEAYAYIDDTSLVYFVANPSGSTVDMVEFGDNNIVAVGANLYSTDGSTTTWLNTFPKTITALRVFENRLYIAQGWSDEYFYTSDLITFTECTLSNSTAKYMSVVGANFWISDSNNTMRVSDNPINGGTAFTGGDGYTVGSDDWDITGLVDHDSIVFARKEDDVYYLSGSDVYSLLGLGTEASTTYTYGLYLWGDCLYIPSGVNSLYEYDIGSGIATVISPVRYASGDANYDEEVLAICHDETYLYCAIDNGSDIKILAGRWETVDNDTDWYWHPLYDKTSNDITTMLISSLSGAKRLYAGTDTYTDGILPFIVPVGYSAVYLESGFKCEASGDFITPWQTSNFPTEDKFWKSKDITSICITGKTSITPYYQVKGGEWTALAACTTSALDDGNYPSETTDSRTVGLSSERIRYKYSMATTDDDYTPILYGTGGGYVSFAVLQATRKRQIVATILVAPYIRERNGSRIARTVATDLSNLLTLYQANGKMTVVGPDSTEYSTVFARNGYDVQLAYGEEIIRPENWWCTVRLLEL